MSRIATRGRIGIVMGISLYGAQHKGELMNPTRRRFLAAAPLAGVALAAETPGDRPAMLGGAKAHPAAFPSWPLFDSVEERAVAETLHSGKWYRGSGKNVARFEEAYAQLTGAKTCLATANGTSALITALNAMGI